MARSDGERRAERTQRRDAARRRAGPNTVLRPSASGSSGGRPAKAYAWLQARPHLIALVPQKRGLLSDAFCMRSGLINSGYSVAFVHGRSDLNRPDARCKRDWRW